MNRRTQLLSICLGLSLAFAAWSWLRPYEWGRDPGTRHRIALASLQHDHSFSWLGIVLQQTDSDPSDFPKPLLILPDGRELEPAETKLAGGTEQPNSSIHLRFWIEQKDLTGPVHLKLDTGTLTVRRKSGPPPATRGPIRYFKTANW